MRTQNDRSKKLETALPSLNWHRLSLLHQEAEADTGVESQTEERFLIALINSAFYFAAVCKLQVFETELAAELGGKGSELQYFQKRSRVCVKFAGSSQQTTLALRYAFCARGNSRLSAGSLRDMGRTSWTVGAHARLLNI